MAGKEETIKSKIELEGEKEYREACKQINSALAGTASEKDSVFSACEEAVAVLTDNSALVTERTEAKREVDELFAIMQQEIRENAQTAQDQVAYDLRYGALTQRYQQARERLKTIETRILERKTKRDMLAAYMDALRKQGTLLVFDERLWNATVETVTVHPDGTLVFCWRDGSETVWKK